MSFNYDYDGLLNDEIEFWKLWGFSTDIKCYFYYDESNNCRKFWIKEKDGSVKFNVDLKNTSIVNGCVFQINLKCCDKYNEQHNYIIRGEQVTTSVFPVFKITELI